MPFTSGICPKPPTPSQKVSTLGKLSNHFYTTCVYLRLNVWLTEMTELTNITSEGTQVQSALILSAKKCRL
jgi:hypothetical protein